MNEPWTPRELIESLSKLDQDRQLDLAITNDPRYPFDINVALMQDTNAILLTPGRSDVVKSVMVKELGIGARFSWRNSLWQITERGVYWIEAREQQFNAVQLFNKNTMGDEPSWFTSVRPFTPNEPKYQEEM